MYEFDNCPNCKVSLIGDPIPDNLLYTFSKREVISRLFMVV